MATVVDMGTTHGMYVGACKAALQHTPQHPLHATWWQPTEPPEGGSKRALQCCTPACPAKPWQMKVSASEYVICTTVHALISRILKLTPCMLPRLGYAENEQSAQVGRPQPTCNALMAEMEQQSRRRTSALSSSAST